jgi:hypothetical protein
MRIQHGMHHHHHHHPLHLKQGMGVQLLYLQETQNWLMMMTGVSARQKRDACAAPIDSTTPGTKRQSI